MRTPIVVVIGCLVCAAAGAAGYLWRPRPANIEAIKQTALRYRREGNLKAFIAVLDQVPASAPEKARAYLEQGRAHWELSQGVEMEEVLRNCIAMEPNPQWPTEETLGAWGTLGDHFIGQERWDEARDVIWKVFDARARQGQPDAFYLVLLLRIRYESAEPAVAIERIRQFLASNPTDYDAHRALGVYLTRAGKLDEARLHLDLAVRARPGVPRFLDSWLSFLFHVSDAAELDQVFAALPVECEERPEFWVYRGKAADLRGDSYAAISCYRKALELDPCRLDANSLLAHALRNAGEKREFDTRILYCQQLAKAMRDLATHYYLLRDQKRSPDAETCARVSELSRELGWEREAEAWGMLR